MLIKFIFNTAAIFKVVAIAAALSISTSVSAVDPDINTFIKAGVNLLEDDSGELVLRFDDDPGSGTFGQFISVTTGEMQEGDIVIGVFDISWINTATALLEPDTELTGVYIAAIADITDVTGVGSFFTGDIEFAAVDPIIVSALLGVTAFAGNVAFFYEDVANNLSISTDGALSAIANATDGTNIAIASISASQDYFKGNDVYLDLNAYSYGTPGVTLRGSIEAGLSLDYWGLDRPLVTGGMCPFGIFGDCFDMVLSGSLLVSELAGFGIQDDTQFSFKTVTPVVPGIDIEKATNGVDADDPSAGDAPQITPGDLVTWTYAVTNTGNAALVNVVVVDDKGVAVNCPADALATGESMSCTASGLAQDLSTSVGTVNGVCGERSNVPLYENIGKATAESEMAVSVEDSDPSHYCNPLPNTAPVAGAGGPYNVDEGSSVSLDSSASSDAEDSNAALTFEWDLDNNGSFETAGASPSFSALSIDGPASKPIALRVTDSGALSHTAYSDVTIANVDPVIGSIMVIPASINESQQVAVNGTFTDPAPADTFTGAALWSDGVATSVSVVAKTFSTSRIFPDDDPSGTPQDSFTASITITDDDSGSDTENSPTVTVNNVAPTANDDGGIGFVTDEDSAFNTASVLSNDTDPGTDQLAVAGFDTTGTKGQVQNNFDGTFNYNPNGMFEHLGEADSENDSFTYATVDDDTGVSNSATVTITVNGVNDEPVIDSVTPLAQIADYSDNIAKVSIVAHDVDSHPLSLSDDAPASLSVSAASCVATTFGTDCVWEMTGQVTVPGDNNNLISFQANDGAAANNLSNTTMHTLTVHPEDATAVLSSDNPIAVEVDDDDSGVFELRFSAWENNDQADMPCCETADIAHDGGTAGIGEMSNARGFMTLDPIGPGSKVEVACGAPDSIDGTGYAEVALFKCSFENVEVNTYEVVAVVSGDSADQTYYEAIAEEGVFVVFDPGLGHTTGGGWFYWPDTGIDDAGNLCDGYPGDRTNFGFNMKYNKKKTKVQGSLLLMRNTIDENCDPAGNFKIKSNAIDGGLSIGDNDDGDGPYYWSAFSGKTTFRRPQEDNEGNHTFLAYVEDRDEQGCNQNPTDEFWVEVRDKDGAVVLDMGVEPPVKDDNTDGSDVPVECGNIIVPHKTGKKGGGRNKR